MVLHFTILIPVGVWHAAVLVAKDTLLKSALSACSICCEHGVSTDSCFRWATQRQVFGKPLTSQAVIRSKLAAMIARVESAQNWLENITYQMNHMNYKEQATHLAG
jgi:hypothetical protein